MTTAPEDYEDAYLQGDRTFEPGTARAAISHPTFRTIYLGAFASNIGTWMFSEAVSDGSRLCSWKIIPMCCAR